MRLDPEERVIVLPEEDFNRFKEACENPSEPTEKLKKAFEIYKRRVKQ